MSLNPEEFLDQETTEKGSITLEPVPAGEFPAVVQKVALRDFKIKRGERSGQTGYSLDVTWLVQDDGVAAELGRPPQVRQGLFLDVGKDGATLDFGKGKNVSLNRLREAVGQNVAGKPWKATMLVGAVAVILVEHRMVGDDTFADVNRVTEA
jgi:hypothetical protein